MEDKVLSLLGLMRKAGAIQIGEDHSTDAIHAGKARLLLLSTDVGENARRRAERAMEGRRVIAVPLAYSRDELAAALGVSGCAMAAVTDLGFANALMKELTQRDPERYRDTAQEVQRRSDKAVRRRRETAARKGLKRNDKRRTEE